MGGESTVSKLVGLRWDSLGVRRLSIVDGGLGLVGLVGPGLSQWLYVGPIYEETQNAEPIGQLFVISQVVTISMSISYEFKTEKVLLTPPTYH